MFDNGNFIESEDDLSEADAAYMDGILANAMPLLDLVNILVRKRILTADELLLPFGIMAPVGEDGQPGPVAVMDFVKIKIGDLLEDLKEKGF